MIKRCTADVSSQATPLRIVAGMLLMCVRKSITSASGAVSLLLCHVQEHDQPSLVGLPHNAQLQISYSAGLQALQLGKYSTALRCFQVSLCTSSALDVSC